MVGGKILCSSIGKYPPLVITTSSSFPPLGVLISYYPGPGTASNGFLGITGLPNLSKLFST
jgi:hypothetical protein